MVCGGGRKIRGGLESGGGLVVIDDQVFVEGLKNSLQR